MTTRGVQVILAEHLNGVQNLRQCCSHPSLVPNAQVFTIFMSDFEVTYNGRGDPMKAKLGIISNRLELFNSYVNLVSLKSSPMVQITVPFNFVLTMDTAPNEAAHTKISVTAIHLVLAYSVR